MYLGSASVGGVSCCLALLAAGAFFDLRYMRVPNWLNAAGLVVALALAGAVGDLAGALRGGLLAFCAYLVLYAVGAIGAGDVKLSAAVGAFLGWQSWALVFGLTVVFNLALFRIWRRPVAPHVPAILCAVVAWAALTHLGR